MKKIISFLALNLLLSNSVYAGFDDCKHLFPDNKPIHLNVQENNQLCFDSFAVLYSSKNKTPIFSVEKLNRATILDARDEVRTDQFYEEARLPISHRALLSDYRGSGYDRGHLAPAADMPNMNAMSQSFSLANIIPQDSTSNRKQWANIEKSTRKFAFRAAGDVYVFSGPAYSSDKPRYIGNGVRVPEFIWKLVYDESKHLAWAYWVSNDDSTGQMKPISYDEFVGKIGVDILGKDLMVSKK